MLPASRRSRGARRAEEELSSSTISFPHFDQVDDLIQRRLFLQPPQSVKDRFHLVPVEYGIGKGQEFCLELRIRKRVFRMTAGIIDTLGQRASIPQPHRDDVADRSR